MNRIPLVNESYGKLLCVSKDGLKKISVLNVVGYGGTSIVYKGRRIYDGQEQEWCIIKEFYPNDNYDSGILYKREKIGGKLEIVVRDHSLKELKKKELIETEKRRQEYKILRECKMLNVLRYDEKNNNPFVIGGEKITFQEDLGDSSYIVLNTTKGKTLEAIIKENGNKLSFEKAIDYFEKLLDVIKSVLGVNYCHCDLKASNLWIEGTQGPNMQMILIDLGSAFEFGEFSVPFSNIESVIATADKLLYDPSIGSCTQGYMSPILEEFISAKEDYVYATKDNREKLALNLVAKINDLDVSVDLYSSLQLLFRMLTGTLYSADGMLSIDDICEMTGKSWEFSEFLFEMMDKNQTRGYHSIDELQKDINVLKTIEKKGAHPSVLLQSIKENFEGQEIDELLLAQIEV